MKCSEIMDALFIGRATSSEGKRHAGLLSSIRSAVSSMILPMVICLVV